MTPVCFVEEPTMQAQVTIDSPETAIVVVRLVEVLDDLLIVGAHAGSFGLVLGVQPEIYGRMVGPGVTVSDGDHN